MKKFFELVDQEYFKARLTYPPFHSTHEGIAVIQEEVDELWDLVKQNKGRTIKDGNPKMVKEAVQIAAMAYAFVKELNGQDDYPGLFLCKKSKRESSR